MKKSNGRRGRFLWITDPWETLDHANDTTLRLAQEALRLGAESFWCDATTIRWEAGRACLDARRIREIGDSRDPTSFRLDEVRGHRPSEFTQLHYRVDPPVDLHYLQPLQILLAESDDKPKFEIVNPAAALFTANEKLEAARFAKDAPASLVASQWERLSAFGHAEGRTVLKPLHEAQSHGVELLDWRTSDSREHARRQLEASTARFTRPVLLQKFLSGISEGEQRLWFLDGKLLANIRKLPLSGDFRVNIDGGSKLKASPLTAREKRVAKRIGAHLRARKIRLAAVDLIEGLITDFNFTSPGLISQMETILGENLARTIVRALLAL